jgi:ATP-dependent exoDNAse (exonuclease V) beta subunit
MREWPFTFSLPAADYPGLQIESQAVDESIVVQGIIDMLIRTADGLQVVDFKTDNVTASEVPGRAELYRPQLDLYARAAAAILDAPVMGKSLYFLRPQEIVQW